MAMAQHDAVPDVDRVPALRLQAEAVVMAGSLPGALPARTDASAAGSHAHCDGSATAAESQANRNMAQDVMNSLIAYRYDGLCPACGLFPFQRYTGGGRLVYCIECGWQQIVEARVR